MQITWLTTVNMSKASDVIYYEGAGKIALQRRLALVARNRIYARFVAEMKPTSSTTILDIGASDHDTREANILEKNYPYPENITCGIIGDGSSISREYPKVKVAQLTPGQPLPFSDRHFDIAYSNAVLEHVGGPDQRLFFFSEAMRVARSIFVIVPNGWFPIEHHTGIPLLHYIPQLFRKALAGTGYHHWSKIENLDFVSKNQLAREWPLGSRPTLRYAGLPLGPFSSNIIIIAPSHLG
jgi:hypothetical protein